MPHTENMAPTSLVWKASEAPTGLSGLDNTHSHPASGGHSNMANHGIGVSSYYSPLGHLLLGSTC